MTGAATQFRAGLDRMGRAWPHARGALLALAIALALIDGCPIPPENMVRPWQKPITTLVRPMQKVLLKPFTWVTRWTRTHQRWALFQAVGRKQWRLQVQGRIDTPKGPDWVTIYRANDPDFEEDKDLLEYRKIRALWNPTDAMSGYTKFANWYLGTVLDHHPEFLSARLRIEKVRLYRGTVEDTGEFDHFASRDRQVKPAPKAPAPTTGPGPEPRSGSGSGSTGPGSNAGPLMHSDPVPPPDAASPVDQTPEGAAP